MKPMDHLALLINRYPVLEPVKEAIFQAYCLLEKCYEGGGKLLIGGNGGSSADSEHIVGELMKGFCKKRQVPEDFAGKPIKYSHMRQRWNCIVLGLQKNGLPVIMPNASMIISKGDIVWIMGSNNNVGRLASEYADDEE